MSEPTQPVHNPSAGSSADFWRLFSAVLAAGPCFYLSWALFNTWANPMGWDDGSWVRFGVGLMLLEFLLVHSGAFMGVALSIKTARKRALAFVALTVVYGLMIWGFAESLKAPELLWIFAFIVVGRSSLAFTRDAHGMSVLIARSATGAFFYLVIVFASVFLPVPEWGIDRSVIASVYPDRGSGIWEKEPYRAIAAGAVYFLVMGVAEFFLIRSNPKKDKAGAAGVKTGNNPG